MTETMPMEIEKNLAALRYLDDERILWGTETTAHNVPPEGVAALIGISGVFYFSHKRTSADAVAYCMNDYLARVQPKLKLSHFSGRAYRKMRSEPFNFTGRQIMEHNERKRSCAFAFATTSAEKSHYPGHYTLLTTYFEQPPDSIHFCFPIGFLLEQRPGYLHEMVADWADHLQPYHGTVGLGTILPTYFTTARSTGGAIYPYLQRFPGLQPDYPVWFSVKLFDGILGVNWYTMVSDELLERIGGREAVAAQLDERFFLWDYPEGLGIMAGRLPELGDSEQGLMPDLYVKLHSVLRPLYSQKIRGIAECLPLGVSTEAFDKEWMYRFDGMGYSEKPLPCSKCRSAAEIRESFEDVYSALEAKIR